RQQDVWDVAWSPDGTELLTATGTLPPGAGAVQRWDAARRQPVGDPLRHTGLVRKVAFQPPSGRSFLSVCDNVVRLWSRRTGKLLVPPLKHPAHVLCAVYSPDGRRLVTGGSDGKVRFWDTATGKPLGWELQHPGPVLALAYSPDGRLLATGNGEPNLRLTGPWGQVRVWAGEPPQLIQVPLNHPRAVRSVACGWGGRLLITGGEDSRVRFFHVPSGDPVGPVVLVDGTVSGMVPGEGGRQLFLSTAGHTAWRLALPSLAELQELRPAGFKPGVVIWSITFTSDGRLVGVGGQISQGAVWDVVNNRELPLRLRHDDSVWAIALRPDGGAVPTGGARTDPGRPLPEPPRAPLRRTLSPPRKTL